MMISNTQSNLLKLISGISGVRNGDFEEERKRSVMAVFLLIGIVVLFPFAAHHFVLGNIARAILLLLVGSTQLFSLVALRHIKHATGIYRLNVILLGAYFLFLVNVGGQHGSRILWVFIFPLLAFFMLGKKEGIFWCALQFLLSVILIADPGSAFDTFPYEREIKSRFYVVYGIIMTMSYVVEAARGRYYTGMERNQISLEKEIKERRRLEEIAAAESSVRKQAEEDLQKAYGDLERRISERTSELRKVNERLRFEIKERQSAEEDLYSSERRLADIINFLPDATFVVDLDGKVIAWNRAIEELTGIPAEKMLGRGNYEYGMAFYGTRRPVMIDLALNWDEKTAREYEYVKRDGTTLVSETRNPSFRKDPALFWNTASPLYDADGEVVGAIEVIRDITERMLAEEALKEAYNILNLSPAVAFLWQNADGWPVQFVTANVENLFGYKADDFLSHHVDYEKTIHPEDLERVAQEVAKYSADKGRLTFRHQPYRIVTADAAVKWVDDRTYIRRNENDEISHYQGIVMDITDQMLMQAALRESEERFRELAENIRDVFWLFDWRNRRLLYVSPAYEEVWGRPIRRIFNDYEEWADSIHPDDVDFVRESFLNIIETGGGDPRVYRICRPDGTVRWIQDRGFAIRGEDGEVKHIAGVAEDITEQKLAEEELGKHREKLEELIEARTRELAEAQDELLKSERLAILGQLTATVSHELRNPLGVIRSSLYYLQQRYQGQDAKIQKHMSRIEDQVEICNMIVGDLLDFTRGRHSQTVEGEINVWLERILDEIDEKGDIAITRFLGDESLKTYFDPDKLRQVIVNLMENAFQAVREREQISAEGSYRPEVKISSKEVQGGVLVQVSDNGIGMDPDILPRATEPLFTTKARGTGLGLAVVQKIIDEHGGGLTIQSQVNSGTDVFIQLPGIRVSKSNG